MNQQHFSPISGVDNFLDKYIATAGYDNKIILWDLKRKEVIASNEHNHLVNFCKFSDCGNFLLSASSDYNAMLWKVPTMEKVSLLGPHTDDVEMAIFHPTEQWIATASRDSKIRTFDFKGHLISEFIGHSADVLSIAWLENGKKLISSGDDGTIRIWDVNSAENISTIHFDGVETDTIAILNSNCIFAGNDLGEIIVIQDGNHIKHSAHESGVKRLYFSHKNSLLVSTSYDKKVKIWKIIDNNIESLICEANIPSIVWPRSCSMIDDHRIVFGTFGSSFAIFNMLENSWEIDHIKKTHGLNSVYSDDRNIYSIGDSGEFFENGVNILDLKSLCNFIIKTDNKIISGGQSGEVYDILSSKTIYKNNSPLNCATQYKINNIIYILIGTYTGECIILKEVENNIYFHNKLKFHNNAIKGIANNGNIIFSVSANRNISFHKCENFELIQKIENAHTKIINACVYINEGMFASISRDLKMKIWNSDSKLLETIETEHTHSLKCISKSSDNNILAVGSYNGQVHLYNLKTKKWFQKKHISKSGVSSICFDSLKNQFLTSSYDGKIYEIRI
jgi:toxoflavin biosynthesis protein ToxC